jgi:hypothetical protein
MFHRILTLVLVLLSLGVHESAYAAPANAPSIADPKLFVGVNVPWINWGCDFGCAASNGVSSSQVRAAVNDQFAQLQAAGIHTVRWWVFEGDGWQINHDASGSPTGLNPAVYTDMDAALALADQYDLNYDFVLFNAPTAIPQKWLSDPGQRQRQADALAPMFDRYKNNPRVAAWEIINEPEWDIWNNKIGAPPVQATVKLLADTIHAHGSTLVTVGSATVRGLPLWVGQGLDFYSPHWYDPMQGDDCGRCTDVPSLTSKYGLDGRPIVIGEFYAGPDTDALQRFKDLRAKGYAAAWAWSLFPDKTNDKLRFDLSAAKAFAAQPAPAPSTASGASPAPSASGATAGSALNTNAGLQLLTNYVTPTYLSGGQTVTVHQDVVSARDTSVSVEFEVLNSQGQTVSTNRLDDQSLASGSLTSLSTTMQAPATPGRYDVKLAVLGPGGLTLSAPDAPVGTFVVDTPPPTPTPVVQPTTDPTDDSAAATTDGGPSSPGSGG